MRSVVRLLAVLSLWTACAAGQAPPRTPCPPPVTFADGLTPRTVRHVAPGGDDRSGDGSMTRPFRSIQRAARGLTPGTALRLHPGTYEGGVVFDGLRGAATAPIWIEGDPAEARPLIRGGHQGLYMTRVSHLVLRHLEIAGTRDNGINVDDGERVDDPEAAHSVVFDDLDIHDTGRQPSGVPDCLKLAGVNAVVVARSRFSRCGAAANGAAGVNGVGIHRALIQGNRFHDTGFGGIQVKGGSADVEIVGNDFRDAGERAINMGGATGWQFFRPSLRRTEANAEAARIHVRENVFVRGEAAAAFVGCVSCSFTANSVVNPGGWVLRILQESVTRDGVMFAPAGRGRIAGNLFLFARADLNRGEDINVGAGTDTASFELTGNAWFARDAPADSHPRLTTFRGTVRGDEMGEAPIFADGPAPYRIAGPGPGAAAACVPPIPDDTGSR